MVQGEQDVLRTAQDLHDQRAHQKLRNFVWNNHAICETDEVKLKLLHLWEESLYQEFIESRSQQNKSHDDSSDPDPKQKVMLSSSMRYKLRKKNPCPIELEHEMRVKNARLPKTVHDGLNAWLKKHQENPYPNKAEKEALSEKLGITPQQVNRWFIQRRKMLRIRGKLYLGRGITDAPSDEDEDHMDMDEDSYDDSYSNYQHKKQKQMLLVVPQRIKNQQTEDDQGSLLEKILTSPRTSPNPAQQMVRSSGGSMEILDRIKYKLEMENHQGVMPLTPPPSISGDSNARSTPPEMVSGYTAIDFTTSNAIISNSSSSGELSTHHPLDLSQKLAKPLPVILEPVSPTWRSSRKSVDYEEEYEEEEDCYQQEQQDLESAERIAVNALMALSRAK